MIIYISSCYTIFKYKNWFSTTIVWFLSYLLSLLKKKIWDLNPFIPDQL